MKIPQLELAFLKSQREKVGEKGSMMISDSVDKKEQRKYEKQQARKDLSEKRTVMKDEKEKRVIHKLAERSEAQRW